MKRLSSRANFFIFRCVYQSGCRYGAFYSIKNKILHIINSDMDKIKEKSLVESQERFNKNKRDENFEKILEKATND